jgi:uncharacterized membrane protein
VSTIERSIDVDLPVHATYARWTRFTDFPDFMEGVERVEQVTDTQTRWTTRIGGVAREFDARIIEQTPDTRICWVSVDGPRQAGEVRFQRLSDAHTRVLLQVDFEPEGAIERVGDTLGLVGRRIEGDLERFKRVVESEHSTDDGWPGQIVSGRALYGAPAVPDPRPAPPV